MKSARQDMPVAASVATTRQDSLRSSLAQYATAPPALLYLRDGEVVLYRRSHSLLYQCRYKLADGTWQRRTTGKASLEQAVVAACDLYDEARYRQRLGLAHRAQSFAQIAAVCVAQLRQQIDAGRKVYRRPAWNSENGLPSGLGMRSKRYWSTAALMSWVKSVLSSAVATGMPLRRSTRSMMSSWLVR